MRSRILTWLPCAGLMAVLLLSVAGAPPADAKPRSDRSWCGNSERRDWVCRWRGAAYAAPPVGVGHLLPRRRARPVVAGTRIATAPNGLARLAFRDEAHCTVGGGSDKGSEVVARWEPDVLMRQISGDFACTSAASRAPVESFCNQDGKGCTVKLSARGTYLAEMAAPPEAAASLTESFHRHAQIVVCSGFVRVQVESNGSFAETVGSSNGRSRYVITIDERVERTEDEIVTPAGIVSTSGGGSSVSIEVVGTVPGRGRCASSFVQTQERTVEA